MDFEKHHNRVLLTTPNIFLIVISLTHVDQSEPNSSFLYPLKTLENLWFDVSGGIEIERWAQMGTQSWKNSQCSYDKVYFQ